MVKVVLQVIRHEVLHLCVRPNEVIFTQSLRNLYLELLSILQSQEHEHNVLVISFIVDVEPPWDFILLLSCQ